MAADEAMLQRLLAVYESTKGTPGDPDRPLLETLSSLELMHFLLAVETAVPGTDMAEFDDVPLASLRSFAKFLAGQPQ